MFQILVTVVTFLPPIVTSSICYIALSQDAYNEPFVVLSLAALGLNILWWFFPPTWFSARLVTFERSNEQIVPIGAGWSFILDKKLVNGNRFFTHQWNGREEGFWFGSGTTIRDAQDILAHNGLTLSSHPTYMGGTLGGWIASKSHGNGGSLWKPAIGKIKVLTVMENGNMENAKVLNHKNMFDPKKEIIKSVELLPKCNAYCERKAFDVHDLKTMELFLFTDTFLRIMFITRKSMLAFIWVPTTKRKHSHCLGSLFPPWLASLVVAELSHWFPRKYWSKTTKLNEANRFAPDPSLFAIPFTLFYTNFEVFINMRVTPVVLLQVCNSLQRCFKESKIKGRCEVRCGKAKLFLDFAVTNKASILNSFECIKDVLGADTLISLHPGKAQVNSHPLKKTR